MKEQLKFLGVPTALLLLSGCGGSSSDSDPVEPFSFSEATVASVHAAIDSRQLSCEEITSGYLERIASYDSPAGETNLNAVIRTNPNAVNRAIELDLDTASGPGPDKPLYCIPVLAKDNINTFDVPTSGGALAFEFNQPRRDAFSLREMREAGAIIIAKANQDELAFGFRGESTVGGLTKNAYDLTKGAGGSSSGTGTGISASLAVIGLGTDTGGSIRVPSAVNGLVGIRPSLRLVSQEGIMPLSSWQDTGGPMCRTVEDCAIAMDAMVGYDASSFSNQRAFFNIDSRLVVDEDEYLFMTGLPESYTEFLDENGLQGARIGVVRELFGDGTDENAIVQTRIEEALETMREAGAIVEDVVVPDLTEIVTNFRSMSGFEFARDLEAYLQSWPSNLDGHIRTYQEFQDSGLYLERYANAIAARNNLDEDLSENEVYILNTVDRPEFVRPRLWEAFDNVSGGDGAEPFDVLLYPSILSLAPELGNGPTAGSANRLSPFSGFPALTMPAGMVGEEVGVSPSLPVAFEMLAREFEEGTLFRIAYAYQQVANPREAPVNFPELEPLAQ